MNKIQDRIDARLSEVSDRIILLLREPLTLGYVELMKRFAEVDQKLVTVALQRLLFDKRISRPRGLLTYKVS